MINTFKIIPSSTLPYSTLVQVGEPLYSVGGFKSMKKIPPSDFVPEGSKLTFIKYVEKRGNCTYSLYKCSCGKEKIIRTTHVKQGKTKSCGCMYKECEREYTQEYRKNISERSTTHGLSKHPLYRVYHGIIKRCYNKNSPVYKRYGAIGVIMCDEWLNDFMSFYNWAISNGWKDGMVIDKDKISIDKGIPPVLYGPDTCSVLTDKQNMNATSSNIIFEYLGRKQTLHEWTDELGLNYRATWSRLKLGWSIEDALTIPSQTMKEINNKRRQVILNKENGVFYFGLKEAADSIGMNDNTLHYMMSGKRKNKTNFIYA